MKKILFILKIIFFSFLFLIILNSKTQKDKLNNVSSPSKIINVGIYQNSPKVFYDKDGTPRGFFVDIIEEIAKKEKWQIIYKKGTWVEGLANLDNKNIHLMVDVAYSEERLKRWDFNKEPVLSDWFQVYTRRGSKINSIVDLMGKKVAVLDQSIQYEVFMSYMQQFGFYCDIIPFSDYKKAFENLSEGIVDACIVNRFYGESHISEYNLKETGIIFHPTQLHYASPKGIYSDILNKIDENLIEMKKDTNSIYYQSAKKWFSEKTKYEMPVLLREIIILISIILFILFLLMFLWRYTSLIKINKSLSESINQRKVVEKELKKHRNHFEELVIKRTKELEELNKELESFSYSISHDLKAPLRSIKGFSKLLLDDYKDKSSGSNNKEKYLDIISKNVDKMDKLIQDLLEFSKAGRKDINKTLIDVKFLISEIYKELTANRDKKRNIDLIYKEIIDFKADKSMIKQVFINLLSNALKFTRNNKKSIIEIGASSNKNNIIYYIKDNGVGFNDKYIDKLFNVFQRLHSEEEFEGTGIGLALVNRIISKHKGKVWAESKLNKGATFYFSIPKDSS